MGVFFILTNPITKKNAYSSSLDASRARLVNSNQLASQLEMHEMHSYKFPVYLRAVIGERPAGVTT